MTMHPYSLIAILLWFLFGLALYLFFGEQIMAWVKRFNAKYGETFAHHFRKGEKKRDPAQVARTMLWVEAGAFLFGMLIIRNIVFALWAVGFVFFAIYYTNKLLHLREAERFDDQLVDITYAMKNSLKAGMTLQQAMQLISTEFAEPAAEQFRIGLREIQIGASVEEALRHIEDRMPNADMKIIVNAIEILRQTGGNMIETFENITETLKNRKRVEGKIKTLTAQGRMQAIILCAMPFVMLLMLYFLNREYVEPLFTRALGIVVLTVVCLLVSTGWVIIKKIITIEV
jgi:tight adherence protein B